MNSAARLACWELVILMGGFFALIFWKLLTGSISLRNLLYGDRRNRSRNGADQGYRSFFSPGRAQLLMFTVSFAMYYLLQVIQDPTKFPPVPNALVAVLGGSQALYLGGKAQSMLMGRLRDLFDRRT